MNAERMVMIQRSRTGRRWKAGVLASSLVLTGTLGFLAAQQPPAPPPIRIRAQVGGAIIPVGGQQVVIGGGIQATSQGRNESGNERVKLPVDPRARRKIEEANRFIETQDWQSAVKILQSLLDATEDNFLQESDGEKGRRVSVRAEANRLLGSLPKEGKQFYEQQFGAQAKLALKLAKAQSNPQALADVALRYVHTEAGAEAAALLGSYHLDHGRYIVAALCFERLLARESGADLPAATLFKAVVAFERSGDAVNRDKAWALFLVKMHQPNNRLPVALRGWDETKLRATVASYVKERDHTGRTDWPLFMGSPDRNGRSHGGAPFLEQRLTPYEPVVAPHAARTQIDDACKKLTTLGVPIIPGSHPLVVRNLVIFRALDGLHAFDLKSGQMVWQSLSDASLAAMAPTNSTSDNDGMNFVINYPSTAPMVLTENTLLGTLSSDQELVYAVEDLALPRMSFSQMGLGWNRRGFGNDGMPQIGNKLADYNGCNHLTAYDLEGGRAVWSIGTRVPDTPFTDTFFLGPPLPIGDKLYVLGESHGEIKLFCLQNRRAPKPGQPGEFQYSAELVWAQPLGVISQQPITEDPVRRTQAAVLAYSDGILVCPTNAGSVIGVDLLTRSLVWAYNYQAETITPDADQNAVFMAGRIRRFPVDVTGTVNTTQWSFSAPVISGGRVYLAPPDGKALHAINLRDGSQAWTVNRVESGKDVPPPDQYLAGVFDGKVILVGKQSVRALDATTGKPLWRTPTGTPAGRGIASESTYYLPVRKNELVSIALADGKITGRSKAMQKEQLGNLVLSGEDFISVNHAHLLVYPIMAVKERQIAERLGKDPNDPVGLIERGELRWHRVGLEAAIADFEQALGRQPPPPLQAKGEAKLAEAMLTLLDQDFARHEQHLSRLQGLAMRDLPADAKADDKESHLERRSRYLRVLAKGREHQGRIGDALEAYVAFAKLDNKLIASPEDAQAKVLPLVWARAQAEAMAKRLKPEWKPQLVAAVQKAFDQVKAADNVETLKAFVDFYGGLGTNGQQAMLHFAEKLAEQREFAAAQIRLLPLAEAEDAVIAARALDQLARLNLRQGELENAAYYFQLLAKRHPAIEVRDGKTGAQLYQELMNDKRFLPYLDQQRGLSSLREVTVEKMTSQQNTTGRERFNGGINYAVHFEPARPVPPAQRRFELFIHVDTNSGTNTRYILHDVVAKKDLLAKSVNALPVYNYGTQQRLMPIYQPCGPAIVFAWSNRLIGLDPVNKKELWSVNLLGDREQNFQVAGFNIMPHQELPGRFQLFSMGTLETIGTVGPGTSRRVVATVKDVGLVGLDPLTGERAWVRGGISTNTELFGDDEYVIVMPPASAKEESPLAVRLLDGEVTNLPAEIMASYQSRLAVRGRHLLTKVKDEAGEALALLDPLGSTIKWRVPLPADSIPLIDGEENELTGFVTLGGEVCVLDLMTGKDVRKLQMNPLGSPGKLTKAYLTSDDQNLYVFLCKDGKDHELKENEPDGGVKQLFPHFQWLKSVTIGGPAAAFDMQSSKLLWQETLPLQFLVTKRLDEMPFLLCSGMVVWSKDNANVPLPRRAAPNVVVALRNGRLEHEVMLFSKQTGKRLPFEGKPSSADIQMQQQGYGGYYAVTIDAAAGTVALKSSQRTLTITLKPKSVASK
jgi:outer membrane protein assembly factor BamB